MFKTIDKCRICGNTDLRSFLNLGEQCLTGKFPASPEEHVEKGPLELVKCYGDTACGLVQLRHTYSAEEMYGAGYGYRSGLNQSMVTHLKKKAEMLSWMVKPQRGDVVLDIGSNDGTLLNQFSSEYMRIGFDPSARQFRHFYEDGISVQAEFFSAVKFAERFKSGTKAKLITSIAMFYDLDDPLPFVRDIAEILADDGVWHLEQSYLPAMMAANSYDTVCHEHIEYYALKQIQWIVERCEMQIIGVSFNDINGGSFAVTIAKKDSPLCKGRTYKYRKLEAEDDYPNCRYFAERVVTHSSGLCLLLHKLKLDRKKVLGYGASTKGNVLLQYCGLTADDLPAIAEVNPDKFGKFTPGSKIPIISEAEAKAMKPDYFLVLPWHFRDNIIEREKEWLAQGGKLIFPLPQIEVYSAPL